MPAYRHFEELPVWQEAARLYNLVLDLLEASDLPLSSGFRNQLDRAALSVSNNVAEGFERVTTNELLAFLAIARGSAGEVRSMLAVVKDRPKLRRFSGALQRVCGLAESCARQLTAWAGSIESSPVQGKRHLTPRGRSMRRTNAAREEFRRRFLCSLPPNHPLYDSPEAQLARSAVRPDHEEPIADGP
ncbi:MAG TPA: four helix bundle protein [Opitutaceae bacterium]|nr:four helix bundle protein [Opitutaceae bacterium]